MKPKQLIQALAGRIFWLAVLSLLIGMSSIPAQAQFVYVANHDSNNISGFKIDTSTGALTPVPGSPFSSAGNGPVAVTVDPTGSFVYMLNQQTSNISAYRSNPITGALTPISGTPFPTGGAFPVALAVDPTGRFLYVANRGSANVSALQIAASTGALTPIPGSPFSVLVCDASGQGCVSDVELLAVDLTGRFVYVSSVSPALAITGILTTLQINTTTGALTQESNFSLGGFLDFFTSLTVAPSSFSSFLFGFLYAGVRQDYITPPKPSTGSIGSFGINGTAGGALSGGPGQDTGQAQPSYLTVDPFGRFLYAADPGDGQILAYTIDSTTGALTPVPGQPFAAGLGGPVSLTIDDTGRFLYAANAGGAVPPPCPAGRCFSPGSITAYTIDSKTGALTVVQGYVTGGTHPISVATTRQCQGCFVVSNLTHLANQLTQFATQVTNGLQNIQSDFRTVFHNPSFTIPGETSSQKWHNLVGAILGLNPGRKEGLYVNLGGRPRGESEEP